jgi:AraC family transcriptional regulator, exoenzyme S synthesis regulatory protein ExsA
MAEDSPTNVEAGANRVGSLPERASGGQPMLNALESLRSDPVARRFEIGDLLFAQFSCPAEDVGVWTQTDYLVHVLSGTSTWKTAAGAESARAGEAVLFTKGAYFLPQHVDGELCIQLYFIPDGFVREVILQLTADLAGRALPSADGSIAQPTGVIRLTPDVALSAFFRAMGVYFASEEDPPEALLRLKLRELLTSLLLSRSNPVLSAYFQTLAGREAPPIAAIMEANYQHNLPLEAFAQMCHRSLSSFKRDFRKHYATSPGRWLLERRLARSVSLLQTTRLSVTEIMLECGFEDLSHFSKAFKEQFGQPPSSYRLASA